MRGAPARAPTRPRSALLRRDARDGRGSRGSRRPRGSTPPGSRAGRRPRGRRPARSARVSSLSCSPSGNQRRVEEARVEAGEHVGLVLRRVGGAGEEQPAAVLAQARVVPGAEPRRADPAGEGEERGEAEAAVAADARVRRLAARVAGHERRDDRLRGSAPAGRASRAGGRARGTSPARRRRRPASSRPGRRRAPPGRSRGGA